MAPLLDEEGTDNEADDAEKEEEEEGTEEEESEEDPEAFATHLSGLLWKSHPLFSSQRQFPVWSSLADSGGTLCG